MNLEYSNPHKLELWFAKNWNVGLYMSILFRYCGHIIALAMNVLKSELSTWHKAIFGSLCLLITVRNVLTLQDCNDSMEISR